MTGQSRGCAPQQQPFFNARSQTAEYAGPGRETPPPDSIEEVKIGWFGPDDPNHPTAGMMWQAATLAVEEANEDGGYHGLPFRLVAGWSENPWGTGIRDVIRLVYDEKVWAIVGAPDGPSAHLVEQVVAKARLAFVSPVSTDKTTNLANVPWIFSCAPGDHLLAPVLADALVAEAAGRGFAVVSCTDHDSRMLTAELLAALRRLDAFPALHLEFRPAAPNPARSGPQNPKTKNQSGNQRTPGNKGAAGFSPRGADSGSAGSYSTHLQRLRQARPFAIALVAGPGDAARFLIAMRHAGLTTPVFGGPAMSRRLFLEIAGEFAEGVRFPLLWHRSAAGETSATFARRFKERFGLEPDYTAAHTYDAMVLLIAATRTAGLNRVRIRDAIRDLSPWPGVTGLITWDPTGHNQRAVFPSTSSNRRLGEALPQQGD